MDGLPAAVGSTHRRAIAVMECGTRAHYDPSDTQPAAHTCRQGHGPDFSAHAVADLEVAHPQSKNLEAKGIVGLSNCIRP